MNIRKSFLNGILFAVVFLAAAAISAEQPKLCAPFKHSSVVDQALVKTMLKAAEKGELFLLQPSTSNLGFGVQSVIGRIEVQFTDFQGGISITPDGDAGQGPALVRIGTKSLKTSGFLVKQMLKSNDFLDVKNYPDVIFASKHLHWQSPNQGILEGTLTLRGVTRPVAFQVDLADIDALTINDAEQIEMKATTTIQRSEFGMTAFPNLAEDEVDLSIQLVAARYANQVN